MVALEDTLFRVPAVVGTLGSVRLVLSRNLEIATVGMQRKDDS